MKVEIDENSGFCFGVVNAIAKAEEELQHGRLYCIGDIVHNSLEVERLKQPVEGVSCVVPGSW